MTDTKKTRDADYRVTHHGTICLVHAVSLRAELWINKHVGDDAMWMGRALAVEPRYVLPLIDGMEADGLRRAR